jgi:hypothetical protein
MQPSRYLDLSGPFKDFKTNFIGSNYRSNKFSTVHGRVYFFKTVFFKNLESGYRSRSN